MKAHQVQVGDQLWSKSEDVLIYTVTARYEPIPTDTGLQVVEVQFEQDRGFSRRAWRQDEEIPLIRPVNLGIAGEENVGTAG